MECKSELDHSEASLSVTVDNLENFAKDLDVDTDDSTSCWIHLADGKSIVELADLAKSPRGDKIAFAYSHYSSNFTIDDNFKLIL